MLAHSEELRRKAESYIANLALVWPAVAFYRSNGYYAGFLRPETQQLLLWLALAYTILGLCYVALPFRHHHDSKGIVFFRTLWRLAREARGYARDFIAKPRFPRPRISHQEKTVFLFLLVKAFFLPMMANFLFGSLNDFQGWFGVWRAQDFAVSMQSFNSIVYPVLIALIFGVDTAYFAFGYAIENSWLRNSVRSVEPTFFGWAVALMCYPPFNAFFGKYLGWYANDYVRLPTEGLTFALRLVSIALFLVYVWATLALGAKCSNLTNRGIVSRGPYRFVRHPAYAAKNLAWIITVLPLLSSSNLGQSAAALASTGAWAFVYFFRAITEERHLLADNEYREYCKKVRHRFIPGVF